MITCCRQDVSNVGHIALDSHFFSDKWMALGKPDSWKSIEAFHVGRTVAHIDTLPNHPCPWCRFDIHKHLPSDLYDCENGNMNIHLLPAPGPKIHGNPSVRHSTHGLQLRRGGKHATFLQQCKPPPGQLRLSVHVIPGYPSTPTCTPYPALQAFCREHARHPLDIVAIYGS